MQKDVDICLLLEGTYPYVRGGVSSWVNQIIKGLPEFSFYLVYLGGDNTGPKEMLYELPDNVVGMEVNYLLGTNSKNKPKSKKGKQKYYQQWQEIIEHFQGSKSPLSNQHLQYILDVIAVNKKIDIDDFLHSEASWQTIVSIYEKYAEQDSFVDFFWTFRNIYAPLFQLAKIARKIPAARCYHSISTGYAGFLGALCHQKHQRPFILTEHGIYTKERKIDLSQASWIADRHSAFDASLHKKIEITRDTWILFFEQLGLTAYQHANDIVALYDGNRQRQINDGAPKDKTQVIVNGINMELFSQAYQQRPQKPPPVVGLIGRVVPIKDIKTFIRSMQIAINNNPELEGWIIGPAEEDLKYYEECQSLVKSLSIDHKIKFLGMQNVIEILPKLGVVMLTSISEAQPLVMLEAMAAGIPCIATEVGSCREILFGMSEEDQALGGCGEITQIASPSAGANAIEEIFKDDSKWLRMGDIGRERVKRYYVEDIMYQSYRELYSKGISWQA